MGNLPLKLGIGMVSIYGQSSSQDIFDPNENGSIVFGTINDMNSQYGAVSVGQSVMYNKNDVAALVFYIDNEYYVLPENKVIAIENEIIPP